jgi:hypothetical protein
MGLVNSRPEIIYDKLASNEIIPTIVLNNEEMDEGGDGSTRVAWVGSIITQAHINWLYKTHQILAGVAYRLPDPEVAPLSNTSEAVVFITHL